MLIKNFNNTSIDSGKARSTLVDGPPPIALPSNLVLRRYFPPLVVSIATEGQNRAAALRGCKHNI